MAHRQPHHHHQIAAANDFGGPLLLPPRASLGVVPHDHRLAAAAHGTPSAASATMAPYPRYAPGASVALALPGRTSVSEVVPSDHLLRTRALDAPRRPVTHCELFLSTGRCARGAECPDAHVVAPAVARFDAAALIGHARREEQHWLRSAAATSDDAAAAAAGGAAAGGFRSPTSTPMPWYARSVSTSATGGSSPPSLGHCHGGGAPLGHSMPMLGNHFAAHHHHATPGFHPVPLTAAAAGRGGAAPSALAAIGGRPASSTSNAFRGSPPAGGGGGGARHTKTLSGESNDSTTCNNNRRSRRERGSKGGRRGSIDVTCSAGKSVEEGQPPTPTPPPPLADSEPALSPISLIAAASSSTASLPSSLASSYKSPTPGSVTVAPTATAAALAADASTAAAAVLGGSTNSSTSSTVPWRHNPYAAAPTA